MQLTHQDDVELHLACLVRTYRLEAIFSLDILKLVFIHESHEKLQHVSLSYRDWCLIKRLTLRLMTLSSVISILEEAPGSWLGIISFGRIGSARSEGIGVVAVGVEASWESGHCAWGLSVACQ